MVDKKLWCAGNAKSHKRTYKLLRQVPCVNNSNIIMHNNATWVTQSAQRLAGRFRVGTPVEGEIFRGIQTGPGAHPGSSNG